MKAGLKLSVWAVASQLRYEVRKGEKMNLIRAIDKEKYRKYYADYNAYVTVIKADYIAVAGRPSPSEFYGFFKEFAAVNELDDASDVLAERFAEEFFYPYEYETIEDCKKLVSKNLIIFAVIRPRCYYPPKDEFVKVWKLGDKIDNDTVRYLVTYKDSVENNTDRFEDMAKDTYRKRAPSERDVSLYVSRKVAEAKTTEDKLAVLAKARLEDWNKYFNAVLYTFAVFVNDELFYAGSNQAHQYYYYPEDALEAGIIDFEQIKPEIEELRKHQITEKA